MKRISFILWIISATLMLQGCQSQENFVDDKDGNGVVHGELTTPERISLLGNFELSEGLALKLLQNFEDSLSVATKGEQTRSDYRVLERQEFAVDVNMRIADEEFAPMSTAIYKVEMRKGSQCGFALVSGDARAANVIAYVPNAADSIDVSTNFAVKQVRDLSIASHLYKVRKFESMKDSLRNSALKKLASKEETRSAREDDIEQVIADAVFLESSTDYFPLTKTTWNQGAPYNCKLARDCSSLPDGRYNTGCGVVSIAQAMAYYEPNLTINAQKINWSKLKRTSQITSGSDKETINQVGFLMKWIGEKVGAEYTCEGTSTGVNSICTALSLVNMQCDKAVNWDWDKIYASLKQGSLVHVSARSTENTGHSWLLDGFMIVKYVDWETIRYVRCNFGWGGSWDGYYEIESKLSFTANGKDYENNWKINPNIKKK